MTQTVEAERWWWDSLTDAEVPENVAHCDTHSCLLEIMEGLAPVRDGGRILDLGCGPGRLAIPFARAMPYLHLIGVDISVRMLQKARKLRERHGLRNVVLLHGDGRTIPPLAGTLDAAYSMLVFQHLPADAAAGYVREVAERLKPGARFAFQVVIGHSDDSFLSHQCPSIEEPLGWCWDAGLEVERTAVSAIWEGWSWVTARKP